MASKNFSVGVIANYFGKPPSCFQLWLDSAGFNSRVHWFFYTDFDLNEFVWPENVDPIASDPQQMRSRFERALGEPVFYRTGWDFCYYKTVLGKCFDDVLSGFDYWGWTDCDMLYGDLDLVTRNCGKADKLMPKGHFSLLRNDADLNQRIAMHPLVRKALGEDGEKINQNFDEELFPKSVLPAVGVSQFDDIAYANFYARYGHFNLIETLALCKALGIQENSCVASSIPCVFTIRSKDLLGWFAMPDHSVRTIPISYVHFFKRNMLPRTERLYPGHSYLIVPNEIREYDGRPLKWDEIYRLDRPRVHWEYFLRRLTMKKILKKVWG